MRDENNDNMQPQPRTSHMYGIYNSDLLETKIPDEEFKELKACQLGETAHKDLVGVVKDQLKLDPKQCPKFNDFVIEMANEFLYMRSQALILNQLVQCFSHNPLYNLFIPEEHFKLKLKQLWLNSMAAGDYQPVHHHSGLFSFVAYVSIPHTKEEEHNLNNGVEEYKNLNGCTEFFNMFGHDNIQMNVNKKIEQTLVLFPSWLSHTVYPFRSDGRRITVSGNIYIDEVFNLEARI